MAARRPAPRRPRSRRLCEPARVRGARPRPERRGRPRSACASAARWRSCRSSMLRSRPASSRGPPCARSPAWPRARPRRRGSLGRSRDGCTRSRRRSRRASRAIGPTTRPDPVAAEASARVRGPRRDDGALPRPPSRGARRSRRRRRRRCAPLRDRPARPGGPTDEGRASYQVALTRCDACGLASIDAAGESHVVDAVVAEMAACDAQLLGDVAQAPTEPEPPRGGTPRNPDHSAGHPPRGHAARSPAVRRSGLHEPPLPRCAPPRPALRGRRPRSRSARRALRRAPSRGARGHPAHRRQRHRRLHCQSRRRHAVRRAAGLAAADVARQVVGMLEHMGFKPTRARALVDAALQVVAPDDVAVVLRAALRRRERGWLPGDPQWNSGLCRTSFAAWRWSRESKADELSASVGFEGRQLRDAITEPSHGPREGKFPYRPHWSHR